MDNSQVRPDSGAASPGPDGPAAGVPPELDEASELSPLPPLPPVGTALPARSAEEEEEEEELPEAYQPPPPPGAGALWPEQAAPSGPAAVTTRADDAAPDSPPPDDEAAPDKAAGGKAAAAEQEATPDQDSADPLGATPEPDQVGVLATPAVVDAVESPAVDIAEVPAAEPGGVAVSASTNAPAARGRAVIAVTTAPSAADLAAMPVTSLGSRTYRAGELATPAAEASATPTAAPASVFSAKPPASVPFAAPTGSTSASTPAASVLPAASAASAASATPVPPLQRRRPQTPLADSPWSAFANAVKAPAEPPGGAGPSAPAQPDAVRPQPTPPQPTGSEVARSEVAAGYRGSAGATTPNSPGTAAQPPPDSEPPAVVPTYTVPPQRRAPRSSSGATRASASVPGLQRVLPTEAAAVAPLPGRAKVYRATGPDPADPPAPIRPPEPVEPPEPAEPPNPPAPGPPPEPGPVPSPFPTPVPPTPVPPGPSPVPPGPVPPVPGPIPPGPVTPYPPTSTGPETLSYSGPPRSGGADVRPTDSWSADSRWAGPPLVVPAPALPSWPPPTNPMSSSTRAADAGTPGYSLPTADPGPAVAAETIRPPISPGRPPAIDLPPINAGPPIAPPAGQPSAPAAGPGTPYSPGFRDRVGGRLADGTLYGGPEGHVTVSMPTNQLENSGSLTGHILAQGWTETPTQKTNTTKVVVVLLVGLGILVAVGLLVVLLLGDAFSSLFDGLLSS